MLVLGAQEVPRYIPILYLNYVNCNLMLPCNMALKEFLLADLICT